MPVDIALRKREQEGRPVRVAIVGSGATGRAIALQLGTPVPGIRVVGIANRTGANAERSFREAGFKRWAAVDSPAAAAAKIEQGIPVLAEDSTTLTRCDGVDVVIEVTGTVDYALGVVRDSVRHGKHTVMVNAELDSTVGPILRREAEQTGVVLTHTDGDEPGVAMTLFRYCQTLGLKPVAAGNIKGMVDYYRTPDTQREFAAKHDQDVRKVTSFADATKLSMETTVLANATGFGVGKRGMYGHACEYVRDLARLLPPADMLAGGIVDYSVGAAPHTGAFVVVHEENPLKMTQLAYYKMGAGPFYVLYTPFHLPHIQIASTIGRAALFGDATVSPLAGPTCEVVAVAKRDLKVGEKLDGVGGFCTYGLIENSSAARATDAIPITLSDGAVMKRAVKKDSVVTAADVEMPAERPSDVLWREQFKVWPANSVAPKLRANERRAS
jgi:predicted homoserine dehydrogenase-like protein